MSISGKNQVRNQASNVWFDLKIPFYDIILLVSYPDYFLFVTKLHTKYFIYEKKITHRMLCIVLSDGL